MNLRNLLIAGSFLSLMTTAVSAGAQESTAKLPPAANPAPAASAQAPVAAEAASTSMLPLPSVKGPKLGNFAITGGLKALTTTGRAFEPADTSGRRAYGKTEYFAGINHASGFGFQAMAVTRGTSYYGDADRSAYGAGNPSVSILHPIYKGSDVKMSGMFRKYFNVTDGAKKRDFNHIAYYHNTAWTLPRGWAVSNLLNPRTFLQGEYKSAQTMIHVDDTTTLTKTVNPWMKLGAGSMFDFERHYVTANGTSWQLFPTAIFTPSENIYVQAAVYFPVHKVNAVDDAPETVALDNTQAQLFMQISM